MIRVGVQGTYGFAPRVATPWVGAGLGYEWSLVHWEVQGEGLSERADVTARGAELANVQAGLDWPVARRVSLGPFAMVTLGRYTRIASSSSSLTAGGERTVHLWSEIGIRVGFDL